MEGRADSRYEKSAASAEVYRMGREGSNLLILFFRRIERVVGNKSNGWFWNGPFIKDKSSRPMRTGEIRGSHSYGKGGDQH